MQVEAGIPRLTVFLAQENIGFNHFCPGRILVWKQKSNRASVWRDYVRDDRSDNLAGWLARSAGI